MKYAIVHRSTYVYERSVDASYHMLRLTPRTLPCQQVLGCEIVADPGPDAVSEHVDYFGNGVRYLTVAEPHQLLTITMRATVDVAFPPPSACASALSWEEARAALDGEVAEFAQDSPFVPSDDAAEYAAASFWPGRKLLEAALDLTQRIYRDFTYDPQATEIATPIAEVMRRRRGVCQDFAHVGIACFRAMGLAARYVSGYIRTTGGLTGDAASHAWLSLYCPGAGWIDLDPTNNLVAGTDHVVLAWGRDYGDVSPVRGVILGGGAHHLHVAVEVTPI